MSDLITSQMLSDWRANYGLDKRTPIKAMHWWQDNMDGKAPAGVVAALGLCINEIERLTAERDKARERSERTANLLLGIHALLYPPPATLPDGRSFVFRPENPGPHAILQTLSDRIRALPDEIAAINAAKEQQ